MMKLKQTKTENQKNKKQTKQNKKNLSLFIFFVFSSEFVYMFCRCFSVVCETKIEINRNFNSVYQYWQFFLLLF